MSPGPGPGRQTAPTGGCRQPREQSGKKFKGQDRGGGDRRRGAQGRQDPRGSERACAGEAVGLEGARVKQITRLSQNRHLLAPDISPGREGPPQSTHCGRLRSTEEFPQFPRGSDKPTRHVVSPCGQVGSIEGRGPERSQRTAALDQAWTLEVAPEIERATCVRTSRPFGTWRKTPTRTKRNRKQEATASRAGGKGECFHSGPGGVTWLPWWGWAPTQGAPPLSCNPRPFMS